MKAQHTPLKEARIVFYGAGSSAVGVATMIAQLISKETGIPFDEAKKVCDPLPCFVFPRLPEALPYAHVVQGAEGCI